jgi:hypothetical protein
LAIGIAARIGDERLEAEIRGRAKTSPAIQSADDEMPA